jgi:hypothetical protein
MNIKSLFYIMGLWTFFAPCFGETITLVCTEPGDAKEHKITIDTEQKTVVHDGRLGINVLMEENNVHYFFKKRKRSSDNKIDLADNYLYMASPKAPPEVGYDRIKLPCRRE